MKERPPDDAKVFLVTSYGGRKTDPPLRISVLWPPIKRDATCQLPCSCKDDVMMLDPGSIPIVAAHPLRKDHGADGGIRRMKSIHDPINRKGYVVCPCMGTLLLEEEDGAENDHSDAQGASANGARGRKARKVRS